MNSRQMLVVFHSSYGQTAKVAERIAAVLRGEGASVDVRSVDRAPAPDPYDLIVIGDALRAGHYAKETERYVRDHLACLNAKPTALFQLSLTSVNPDETHTAQARQAMDDFLVRTGLQPRCTEFFAGALPYTRYRWIIRRIMRWISRREGGDTDTSRDYEYTDWDAVERFAKQISGIGPDPGQDDEHEEERHD